MHWLFDLRFRYGYYGSLLLGSHWVIGALGEGETTVTTRTRNTGLTRLPHVAFISFQRFVSWWVFMGGWETLYFAQQRNGILVGQRKPSTYLFYAIMANTNEMRIMRLAWTLILINCKNVLQQIVLKNFLQIWLKKMLLLMMMELVFLS